jgi:hypothetical protein
MNRFISKCFFFLLVGTVLGEVTVRLFHLNTDVPEMYKNLAGLIKFKPNQTGYWKGSHKWKINKYGQFGYQPESLDNLYTVIGDSYITNAMNPPECHQANYLHKYSKNYDFFPASRDGASFIEFMEMKNELDSLKPRGHLLYVHQGDFIESIRAIRINPNTMQVDLHSGEKSYPVLTSSRAKDLLYNLKFFYFLYRNYIDKSVNATNNRGASPGGKLNREQLAKLIEYTKLNYDFENVYLVFSPDSDDRLIQLLAVNGFNVFKMSAPDYKSWQLADDSHWSCYGHEQAAKQVSAYLTEIEN